MGAGPGAGWGVKVLDAEVQALLAKVSGPEGNRRVEDANLECAALIESRAARLVHVLTGALQGSLDADLGAAGPAGIRFAWVGASEPYAAIEELRGLTESWGDINLEQAARGEHSYLARAYVESLDALPGIYLHHLDPGKG
jgi:hypothetical protein